MKNIITYIDVNIEKDTLERHPLHIRMFGLMLQIVSTLQWLRRCFEQFGKLKSIYAVQEIVDGVTKTYIIDGWKSYLVLKDMGITTIRLAILNLTEEKDIAQVMAELQKTHHNSLEEEYSTYETLYSIFSKGRGHRSDLHELTDVDAEEAGITEEETKNRRETVYDVIGKMCGVSKNRVMYVLKIGKVNPWHFERIEKEKYALYAAYLKCLAEEKGEEPEVPQPKAPVYHSNPTETSAYTEPTSTADSFNETGEYGNGDEQPQAQSEDHEDDGMVTITAKLPRKDLAGVDVHNVTEVKVDNSDPKQVVVILTFPKI